MPYLIYLLYYIFKGGNALFNFRFSIEIRKRKANYALVNRGEMLVQPGSAVAAGSGSYPVLLPESGCNLRRGNTL
jgi:hypothetical protein